MLKKIVNVLDDVKLKDIKVYKVAEKSPFYDYMVIATATNTRQNQAAVKHLKDMVALNNFEIKNVEGNDSAWILIDMYEVIIHIFTTEERKFYDLDKLYLDYDQISLKDLLK